MGGRGPALERFLNKYGKEEEKERQGDLRPRTRAPGGNSHAVHRPRISRVRLRDRGTWFTETLVLWSLTSSYVQIFGRADIVEIDLMLLDTTKDISDGWLIP